MVIDSSNQLHVILSNRVGNPAVGGMWHGVWLGNNWGELEMITAKTPQEGLAAGGYKDGNSASRPNAVISQGNVLLSTWWHDMGDAPPAAFSYALLDAPVLPSVPLPAAPVTTASNTTATHSTPTPLVTPTSTPSFVLQDSQKINVPDSTSTTSGVPLLLGVILGSVVILASIISRKLLFRNN
jgi:hypothetical protein